MKGRLRCLIVWFILHFFLLFFSPLWVKLFLNSPTLLFPCHSIVPVVLSMLAKKIHSKS